MARTFDGTDDKVTLSLGANGFASSPITIAAIVRRSADPVDSAIVGLGDSNNRHSLRLVSNVITLRVGGADMKETLALTASEGWALIAATKTTGTTAPRFHKYVFSTNAHTHEADTATRADDATAPLTHVLIGARGAGQNFWQGDIAVVGVWSAALSDAQVEALAFDLNAWFAVQPTGLWLLDQAATTMKVNDLTGGGANESTLTGTTVATSAVPTFSYGHPILVC